MKKVKTFKKGTTASEIGDHIHKVVKFSSPKTQYEFVRTKKKYRITIEAIKD